MCVCHFNTVYCCDSLFCYTLYLSGLQILLSVFNCTAGTWNYLDDISCTSTTHTVLILVSSFVLPLYFYFGIIATLQHVDFSPTSPMYMRCMFNTIQTSYLWYRTFCCVALTVLANSLIYQEVFVLCFVYLIYSDTWRQLSYRVIHLNMFRATCHTIVFWFNLCVMILNLSGGDTSFELIFWSMIGLAIPFTSYQVYSYNKRLRDALLFYKTVDITEVEVETGNDEEAIAARRARVYDENLFPVYVKFVSELGDEREENLLHVADYMFNKAMEEHPKNCLV